MKRIHAIFTGYKDSEKKSGKIAFAKAEALEQKIIKESRERKQDDASATKKESVKPLPE